MPRSRETQSQPEFQENMQNYWQEIEASLEEYERQKEIYDLESNKLLKDVKNISRNCTAEIASLILKSEVEWAVKHMQQGKSRGPDEIPTEMLLALEGVGIDLLFNLIAKIYVTGTFPADMLKSVSFPPSKIPGTLD